MAPIVHGYWAIRGYGQPIRLMLAAAGADFVEEFQFQGANFSKEAWFKVKPTLPLDFPNLPYLYDGEVKITQSISIMRYLGRTFDLWPGTGQQAIRVDLIEQQIVDWRMENTDLFYDAEFENKKEEYIKQLASKVNALSRFLGTNDWLAGNKLTYVDFVTYEWLDVHKLLYPEVLDEALNLREYVKRFESIEKVKQYMDSKNFMKWPVCNDQASWGTRNHFYPRGSE